MMASCFVAHATEPDSWQRPPNEDQIANLINLPTVPKTKIYEVVPTKVETAVVWRLASAPFAVLTCADADFLAGGHYSCDENAKPILVRAVYANGVQAILRCAMTTEEPYTFTMPHWEIWGW